MHPWIKSDKPGKCTICSMDLTPVMEGASLPVTGSDGVVLKRGGVKAVSVRTHEVRRGALTRTLRVTGTLEPNEKSKTVVSAPSAGRIQSTSVGALGEPVTKGASLATLFSPDLVQKRFFLRSVGGDQSGIGRGLVHTPAAGSDPYLGEILSPISGVVLQRNVYPGQYVVEGEKLFTIADPSVVWFEFDAYDRQLPWLKVGQPLDLRVPALPERRLQANITFIEPVVNPSTRTLRIRAEVQNPETTDQGHTDHLLQFGLLAEASVRSEVPDALLVPRSAVLRPGSVAYVYLEREPGSYFRRRVTLGRQGDDAYEVVEGLDEGDRIVTAGNVLIDAQAQLESGSESAETILEVPTAPSLHGPGALGASPSKPLPPGHLARAGSPAVSMDHPLDPGLEARLNALLEAVGALNSALAADDLTAFKKRERLFQRSADELEAGGTADPVLHPVIGRVVARARWASPVDLASARRVFGAFSAELVDLAQLLRTGHAGFKSLKVYRCPMAPKPGLWVQASAPLRNPYKGPAMLACGEEVPPLPGMAPSPGRVAAVGTANPEMPASPLPREGGSAAALPGGESQHGSAGRAPGRTSPQGGGSSPVGRTGIMGAIMSPGSELQMMRRRLIQEANAGERSAAPETLAPVRVGGLECSPGQVRLLTGLIQSVEGIGRALADGNLKDYFQRSAALPTWFGEVRDAFGPGHPWHTMMKDLLAAGLPVARSGDWHSVREIGEARTLFQPFSAQASRLAIRIRRDVPALASVRVYQRALEEGSTVKWIQASGPVANPFGLAEAGSQAGEVLE
ncbi:MAG TPA: hypothetical protein DCM86_15950 [Verrucomicrobiales bacterium]|nr:hypothetical protein [Verrucomicrobiales bacterium]